MRGELGVQAGAFCCGESLDLLQNCKAPTSPIMRSFEASLKGAWTETSRYLPSSKDLEGRGSEWSSRHGMDDIAQEVEEGKDRVTEKIQIWGGRGGGGRVALVLNPLYLVEIANSG